MFKCFNINILVLDRNSAFSISNLIAELQEFLTSYLCNRNALIVEDFNICLKSTGTIIFSKKKTSSLLGVEYSTTLVGTKIEWAFSNMDPSLYEMHGYHDSIYVSILNKSFQT